MPPLVTRVVTLVNKVPMVRAGRYLVRLDDIYNVANLRRIDRAKHITLGAKVRIKEEEFYDPSSQSMVVAGPCGVVTTMEVTSKKMKVVVTVQGEQDYLVCPDNWKSREIPVDLKQLVCLE